MNYSTKTANQILLRDESRQLVLDEIWDNFECLWKEASLRTLLVCCFKYLACKISWLLLLLSKDVSSRDEEVDDDGDDMDDMIVPESAKRWYYIFTLFDTHLPPPSWSSKTTNQTHTVEKRHQLCVSTQFCVKFVLGGSLEQFQDSYCRQRRYVTRN